MSKPLQVWNGRSYGWHIKGKTVTRINACAHSVADFMRLAESLGARGITRTEVKQFFSPCWGDDMKGVTPERGIWANFKGDPHGSKPTRVKL